MLTVPGISTGTSLNTRTIRLHVPHESMWGQWSSFRYEPLPLTAWTRIRIANQPQDFIPTNTKFHKLFLDLLQRIFVYDPKNRITAKEALKHQWFKESLVDDGTEALRIGEQLQRTTQRRWFGQPSAGHLYRVWSSFALIFRRCGALLNQEAGTSR